MCDWLRIERPTREWDCGDDAQEVAGGNLPDITRFDLATMYVSFVVGKNVANSLSVFDSLCMIIYSKFLLFHYFIQFSLIFSVYGFDSTPTLYLFTF